MTPPSDPVDTGLWDAGAALSNYHEPPVTAEILRSVEVELGFRLPGSYVELARSFNGGTLRRTSHPSPSTTSWASDHVGVTGIFAVGRTARWSLCGEFGQHLWVEEWGYPDWALYVADCPSAGHDMIGLDYRACGPLGEPTVIHVDQEFDYAVTTIAPDFAAFLDGLVTDDAFDLDP